MPTHRREAAAATRPQPAAGPMRAINAWDVCVALGVVGYAVVFWLGAWQGRWPFVELGGDSANILSWAVARDDPGAFVRDSTLASPEALGFYATIHIPLVRILGPLIGDYGVAWLALLVPHVAMQALGFYCLGRVLFRHRGWALLLAVVTTPYVPITLGTYWGTYVEPQPRFTFQAALPWVLALAVHWRDRPSRWPWLLGLAGGLFYLHPVSAPAWGFALWLGLWGAAPAGSARGARLRARLLAAVAFVAAALPFLYAYVGSQPAQALAPETIKAAMDAWVPDDYRDVRAALTHFGLITSLPPRGSFWVLAAIGCAVVWGVGGRARALHATVCLWVVGVMVVSVGLPWVDQTVAAARNAPTVQVDLVRGVRFLVMLKLLFVIWPLAALDGRLRSASGGHRRAGARLALVALGLWATSVWIGGATLDTAAADAISRWRQTGTLCREGAPSELATLLGVIARETPPGATIVASKRGIAPIIRYHARRPVPHDWRDISVLLYAHRDRVGEWQRRVAAERRLRRIPTRQRRFAGYREFASSVGADYAVLDSHFFPSAVPDWADRVEGAAVVWHGEQYALVRIDRHASPTDR